MPDLAARPGNVVLQMRQARSLILDVNDTPLRTLLAGVLPVIVSLSGCSLVAMPLARSTRFTPPKRPVCAPDTTGVAGFLDAVVAVPAAVASVGIGLFAVSCPTLYDDGDAAANGCQGRIAKHALLPVAIAAVFGASAIVGTRRANRCRAAQRDFRQWRARGSLAPQRSHNEPKSGTKVRR